MSEARMTWKTQPPEKGLVFEMPNVVISWHQIQIPLLNFWVSSSWKLPKYISKRLWFIKVGTITSTLAEFRWPQIRLIADRRVLRLRGRHTSSARAWPPRRAVETKAEREAARGNFLKRRHAKPESECGMLMEFIKGLILGNSNSQIEATVRSDIV